MADGEPCASRGARTVREGASTRRLPHDIDTLLIELAEKFTLLMREKQHELKLELPEATLGEIISDQDRIKQILTIFLDNAIEHTPKDTEILVRSYKRKKRVYMEVSDKGNGIADEDKPKIFDRFYKADKSRIDKLHFGLGLSIAKEMANLIHGDILVTDTLGGGTTFTLNIPL